MPYTYTGTLRNPANQVASVNQAAKLTFYISQAARAGDTLVNTEPVVVTEFISGSFAVTLFASDELASTRPVFYTITEELLDPDGGSVPGSFTEWPGKYFLPARNSPISEAPATPMSPSTVWVGLTRPPAGSGYFWWLHATGNQNLEPGTDPGTGDLYYIPGGA